MTFTKKTLPKFPQRIGVVTSPTGAAIQDILQQLRKRYPLAKVLLHPTLVQGDGAPQGIAAALQAMNQQDNIDVLIVRARRRFNRRPLGIQRRTRRTCDLQFQNTSRVRSRTRD